MAERSNLTLRIYSAVVLIVIALGAAWLGGLAFRAFAVIVGAAIFYEWATMSQLLRERSRAVLAALLVALPMAAVLLPAPALTVVGLTVASTLAWLALSGRKDFAGRRIAVAIPYAAFSALSLAMVRDGGGAGLVALLYLFAVVWAGDILAYFVGRRLGGPKLAPSISPGKTWSGAIGGLIAAVAAGALVIGLAGGTITLGLLILTALLSAVAQIGDLFESSVKRRFAAKDSSRLIPGHGGVMDRVDGLVAAAMALAVAAALIAGPDATIAAILLG